MIELPAFKPDLRLWERWMLRMWSQICSTACVSCFDGVASAGAVDMARGAGSGFGDILVILAGCLLQIYGKYSLTALCRARGNPLPSFEKPQQGRTFEPYPLLGMSVNTAPLNSAPLPVLQTTCTVSWPSFIPSPYYSKEHNPYYHFHHLASPARPSY